MEKKERMERVRKANNLIEVISHLLSVQLFCIFLRICASCSGEPIPLPGSEMSEKDRTMGNFFGIFSLALILITFPWSFKAAAKGMTSARSWSFSIRFFTFSLALDGVFWNCCKLKCEFWIWFLLRLTNSFFRWLTISFPTTLTLIQLPPRPLFCYSLNAVWSLHWL